MQNRASARHVPALLVVAAMAAACDSATAPDPGPDRPDLDLNTVAITVTGAMALDEEVEALGGFQHVTTGDGTGIRIGAVPSAAALSIHLPGTPHAGQFPLGRWDPAADFARHDTIPIFHGHSPRISFGGDRAVVLGPYSSFEGVVLIDSVTVPEYGNFNSLGEVRGRIEARAALDTASLGLGVPVDPDTVDITVEFRVALEGWHDGRADASFVGGSLAGRTAPGMYGSGNQWYIGGFPNADPQLVVLLQGTIAGTGERLAIWYGTKLEGPGIADIVSLDPDDVQWPSRWPDHFVAAMIGGTGGTGGRSAGAISGRIELDAHEPYAHPRWGDTRGRLVVELEMEAPAGAGERERTIVEVDFHVPSFWFVSYETGGDPASARPVLAP